MQVTIEANIIETDDPRVQYMLVEDMLVKIEDDKVVGFYRPDGEPPEEIEVKNWISINPYYAECPYCGQLRFRRDEGWSYCPHCGNKTTGRIRA